MPVYSISSVYAGKHNMNIITYVTATSMSPKKIACCIYDNTQTRWNVEHNEHFVLQLLAADQYRLVTLLGQQSGKSIDKIARLNKRNMLEQWKGFYILSGALAVMELCVDSSMPAGDHTLFLCDVVSNKNIREGEPLSLDILREKKLVRI